MRKCKLIISMTTIALLSIVAPVGANNNGPDAAKPRIEREFRQLETAISRLMYNSVLPAGDVGTMNRRLYEFMRDNPGVLRILRTNATGITINDVSADSPQSETPRNLSGQRWFKDVAQYRQPYYSMDHDNSGELTLFYAWPLMTGSDRSRFSGAFAAIIDFAAHAALIDNVEPFQLALNGRAFFEHEWDNVDWNETHLDIRGASGISIRTEAPIPTRDQVAPQRRRAEQFTEENKSEETDDESAGETLATTTDKNTRSTIWPLPIPINAVIITLLTIIGALVAYSFIKSRASDSKRFVKAEAPPPQTSEPANRVIVQSMADIPIASKPETETRTMPAQETRTIPAQPQAPTNSQMYQQKTNAPPETTVDAEKIGKMLALIKSEFAMMDKKIQILHRRIEALEIRLG